MPVNMSIANIVIFVGYVLTSCGGLYLMKAAAHWKTPMLVMGVGCYGLGALIWLVIVRMMPLSIAFPIASGAIMLGTMLSGYFLLSETIALWHMVGALMILGGIVLIAAHR